MKRALPITVSTESTAFLQNGAAVPWWNFAQWNCSKNNLLLFGVREMRLLFEARVRALHACSSSASNESIVFSQHLSIIHYLDYLDTSYRNVWWSPHWGFKGPYNVVAIFSWSPLTAKRCHQLKKGHIKRSFPSSKSYGKGIEGCWSCYNVPSTEFADLQKQKRFQIQSVYRASKREAALNYLAFFPCASVTAPGIHFNPKPWRSKAIPRSYKYLQIVWCVIWKLINIAYQWHKFTKNLLSLVPNEWSAPKQCGLISRAFLTQCWPLLTLVFTRLGSSTIQQGSTLLCDITMCLTKRSLIWKKATALSSQPRAQPHGLPQRNDANASIRTFPTS